MFVVTPDLKKNKKIQDDDKIKKWVK